MPQEKWFQKEVDLMIKTVGETKTKKELTDLFDQILTTRELNDMGRRLAVVNLLKAGKTYHEIAEQLKVAPTTIARISNKIGFGFRRNYQKLSQVNKLDSNPKKRKSPLKYKGATPIHRMLG
jgi:TrpR-related protein YerC/YecD